MRYVFRHPNEIEVVFSDEEVQMIWHVAITRQSSKEGQPVRDRRLCGERIDNMTMHRIGLTGEFAVGRVIGLTPDLSLYLEGDRGDFTLHGTLVEVKTLRGFLILDPQRMGRSGAYVLVVYLPGEWYRVWVQGWTTERKFLECAFDEDFGYGPRRAMQPADMYPMATLAAHCAREAADNHIPIEAEA